MSGELVIIDAPALGAGICGFPLCIYEEVSMALTVLEVFKILPRTNCGDCGEATCLAFATQVIKEGAALTRCPHLSSGAQEVAGALKSQQQAGVGRRRERVAIAREAMQEKVAPLDFAELAAGLEAEYGEEGGRPFLRFPYFGGPVKVFKKGIEYSAGAVEDPWDAILLYNYIASRGGPPLTGEWVALNSLPNSVSKAKTLTRLEEDLAAKFAGRLEELRRAGAALGGQAVAAGGTADFKMAFFPLPRVPILMSFWDAEAAEGFGALVRFLFDRLVGNYLDLESLLFLVEKLAERLEAAAGG